MGRSQKFKKLRKIEKIEKEKKNKENQKLFFTSIISVLVIVIGGFWLNNWYQKRMDKMDDNKQYEAVMHTSMGDIRLGLDKKSAPKTVENFVGLAKKGYYDGTLFHRVIADFMIQGGDPNSKDDDPTNDGMGGESFWGGKFDDEINPISLGLSQDEISALESEGYVYNYDLQSKPVTKGVIAMANSGPNSNGSQFFIVTESDQVHLNGRHTVFGEVIGGMEVVSLIANAETGDNDRPIESVIINSIDILETEATESLEEDMTKVGEQDMSIVVEGENNVPFKIEDLQVDTGAGNNVNVEMMP